jgi:hypothetical protein
VHLPAARSAPPDKARTKTTIQDEVYARQTAWLDWLKTKTGKSLAALARDAGRSPSLLTRKFAEGGLLTASTIELLMESTGLPGPDTYLLPGAAGIADEGLPIDPAAADASLKAMIEAALKGRSAATPWQLRTRALEGAGYLSGDIVISDQAVVPMAGDAVVAQVYDLRTGAAETVFRILEAPYLVAASADPALRKPLLVDNDRVIVMGVITHSFRTRRT